MSELTFKFNGYNSSGKVRISSNFIRGLGPTRTINSKKIGQSLGTKFINITDDSTKLVVPFIIQAGSDTFTYYEELREALHVNEPVQLIFSDKPDRYWLAMPDNLPDPSHDKPATITGELTFTCYFPYAQAIEQSGFNMQPDGNIEIYNAGNVPTPVDFTAVHSGDNGFVGFAGEDAVIQEGSPNELDGENTQPNSLMWIKTFDTRETTADFELNKFPSNYQHISDRLSGNWNYAPGRAGDYRAYPTYAEGTNTQIWYGPSMFKAFTGTPKNWKIDIMMEVLAKKAQTLGAVEWGVVDAQGNLIAGFRIRKLDYKDTGLELHVLVGSDKNNNIRAKWEGKTTWIIRDYFGHMSIEKDGDYLRMRFANETTKSPWGLSYYYPNQPQAYGFNYWAGSCSPSTRLDVSLFFVRCWDNTVRWRDSKNVFSDMDVLQVKTVNTAVVPYVNGSVSLGLQAPGSEPIMVPPGWSTVRAIWSSWTKTPPQVTATIRERWI